MKRKYIKEFDKYSGGELKFGPTAYQEIKRLSYVPGIDPHKDPNILKYIRPYTTYTLYQWMTFIDPKTSNHIKVFKLKLRNGSFVSVAYSSSTNKYFQIDSFSDDELDDLIKGYLYQSDTKYDPRTKKVDIHWINR